MNTPQSSVLLGTCMSVSAYNYVQYVLGRACVAMATACCEGERCFVQDKRAADDGDHASVPDEAGGASPSTGLVTQNGVEEDVLPGGVQGFSQWCDATFEALDATEGEGAEADIGDDA